MTFVVTENCINCRYTDCVEVCPVDCFHVGPNFIVIDPDECIDCTLCEPECPAEAIYPEDDLPAGQEPGGFRELQRPALALHRDLFGVFHHGRLRSGCWFFRLPGAGQHELVPADFVPRLQ